MLVALVAIGAGALASAALADSGGAAAGRGHPLEVEPRFQLAGSHGYRLLVSARAATVTIGVAKDSDTPHAGSSTTYVARGTAGPNGIHASFHQFGRVEVKFHPAAEAVRGLPPDCFGGTTGAATVPGYFTGTFDFHGQGDYTVARTRRVRGEVVLPPTEQCPLVAGGANPLIEDPNAELPPAKTRMTLSALDKAGTGGLFFIARRAGKTGFYAERFGTVGRIGMLSLDYALGPRSSFASDPKVSFGSVHPPKPFVGSATLSRGPDGKRSWSGSLTATFPGGETVPLTGTQFHTTLSRSFPWPSLNWHSRVLSGAHFGPSIALANREGRAMFYAVLGYLHAALWRVNLSVTRRVNAIHALAGERGQGTVEYVGLILLVSLLMVGMVAAMKGFNGKQGTELADVIINKIKEAVDKVAFK